MFRIARHIAPLALFTVLAAGCTGTGSEQEESILELLPGQAAQEFEKHEAHARGIAALKDVCNQFNNSVGAALGAAGVETKVEGIYHEPEEPESWFPVGYRYDKYKDYGECIVKAGGQETGIYIFAAYLLADQQIRDKIANAIVEAMPPGDLVKIRDNLPALLPGTSEHARDEALLRAATDGNTGMVKALLAAGASVHAGGDAALRWAAWKGHSGIVELLLKAGADVHARDDEAVRAAYMHGHEETVKILLESGADVHACGFLRRCDGQPAP